MIDWQGLVETFDGQNLTGWVGSSIKGVDLAVDVYVDGQFDGTAEAKIVRADLESSNLVGQALAFEYRFEAPFCDPSGPLVLPRVPRLGVHWKGSDAAVPVSRDLRGVVNVQDIGSMETFLFFHDDRFQPVPGEDLRAHVAGQGVSESDYRAVGKFVAIDLMHLGLLWTNSRIVDIGCGCGRVAAHLAPVLNESGRYWGFDTWRKGIDWATEEISSVYKNAEFKLLSNSPGAKDPGYVGESAYTIPLADASVDLVLCASLFTHLTFEAALGYLREIRRLIGPSGRAFVSCFILDEEAEKVLAPHRLTGDSFGKYSQHEGFFDSYFRPETFARLFEESGLTPVIQRYGHWRGRAYSQRRPIGYQDLFILKELGRPAPK